MKRMKKIQKGRSEYALNQKRIVMGDRRTKRARTRTVRNRRAIEEQS